MTPGHKKGGSGESRLQKVLRPNQFNRRWSISGWKDRVTTTPESIKIPELQHGGQQ